MQALMRAGLAVFLVAGMCHAQAKIPAVSGTTLNGDKVNLPQDSAGRPAVLIVGFSQGSREQVTGWGKRLAADVSAGTDARYYEMPVLAAVPKLLRGLVLKKIAKEVSGPAKNHFLPLYDHEAEWREAAGYRNADDAYVLLIDGDGAVRWSCAGSVSDARNAELNQRLTALRRP